MVRIRRMVAVMHGYEVLIYLEDHGFIIGRGETPDAARYAAARQLATWLAEVEEAKAE